MSNYGKTERYKEIIQEGKKNWARENLKQSDLINEYVGKYKKSKNKIGTGTRLERDLVKSYLGHQPQSKDELSKAKSLVRRFRIGLAYGEDNPRIGALIGQSNNIKVELLKEFGKELSTKDFNKLKEALLKYKVVSSTLLRSYKRNR